MTGSKTENKMFIYSSRWGERSLISLHAPWINIIFMHHRLLHTLNKVFWERPRSRQSRLGCGQCCGCRDSPRPRAPSAAGLTRAECLPNLRAPPSPAPWAHQAQAAQAPCTGFPLPLLFSHSSLRSSTCGRGGDGCQGRDKTYFQNLEDFCTLAP